MAKGAKDLTTPLDAYSDLYHERYEGTKEQLAAVGIPTEKPFPGEPGGPPRGMTVVDALGRKWKIGRAWRTENRFVVERGKLEAERAAMTRREKIEKDLGYAIRTKEHFVLNTRATLRLVTALVERTAGIPSNVRLPPDEPSAYRLPHALCSRLAEMREELQEIEQEIDVEGLIADAEGQTKIRTLENARDLYGNPAFALMLAGSAS